MSDDYSEGRFVTTDVIGDSDMPDLDTLFEDEPVPEQEVNAPEPVPEGEKPAEPEKEPPVAPPATEKPNEADAYKAAMLEERRKRQDIERRIQEMEKAKPEEPKKEFWIDPEGVVDAKVDEIEQRFTQRFLRQSESHARKRYEDYDDRIGSFKEAVNAQPHLYQQMLESDDPAEFAYSAGKTYEFTKDAPTIDALEKKLEAKLEAKLREKLEQEYAEKYGKEHLSQVPPSLTDETGTTNRMKPDPTVSPLDEIFPN